MKTFKTISLNKSKFTCIAFCVSFFFFTATLQAQEIEISGTLKGKTYDKTTLLDGVNILLKGTKTGTTTNKKGEFTFPKKLKAGDILVFSYLGLAKQNIKIKENSSVLMSYWGSLTVKFFGITAHDWITKRARKINMIKGILILLRDDIIKL